MKKFKPGDIVTFEGLLKMNRYYGVVTSINSYDIEISLKLFECNAETTRLFKYDSKRLRHATKKEKIKYISLKFAGKGTFELL